METEYIKFFTALIYPHIHEFIRDKYELQEMQVFFKFGKVAELHKIYQSDVCEMILNCTSDTQGMKDAFFLERVMREAAVKRISSERFIDLTREWLELHPNGTNTPEL